MFRTYFLFLAVALCCGLPSVAYAAGLESAEAKVRTRLMAIEHYFRREAIADSEEVRDAVTDFIRVLPNAGFDEAFDVALKHVEGDAKAEARVLELVRGSIPLVEEAEAEYVKYQALYQREMMKQQQAAAKSYQRALQRQRKAMQQGCKSSGRSPYGRTGGKNAYGSGKNPLKQMAQSRQQFQRYLNRNSRAYKRLLQIR